MHMELREQQRGRHLNKTSEPLEDFKQGSKNISLVFNYSINKNLISICWALCSMIHSRSKEEDNDILVVVVTDRHETGRPIRN